jgi:uncharacterized membrane-anchored protein
MAAVSNHHATKVPAVTLGFWIIKILATTLGETGGDTFSMTMDLGYLVSMAIFSPPCCSWSPSRSPRGNFTLCCIGL